MTYDQYLSNAADELRDWADDIAENRNPRDYDPSDAIHEIADGSVPVYHSELLDLAAERNHLATDEPELGPAFDGSPTAVNIIAANMYEAAIASLYEVWDQICDEFDSFVCDICGEFRGTEEVESPQERWWVCEDCVEEARLEAYAQAREETKDE